MREQYITLAHGSGGVESNELISGLMYEILGDYIIDGGEDAGVGELSAPVVVSTDSYVVSPPSFPGGDIGKLCVCGSSNDVAMRGGKPRYLSLGLILEEGLEVSLLRQILESIRDELHKGELQILSGDTKVVPRGLCDKLYINTTAIGELRGEGFSTQRIQVGDQIIVSAPIGTHGAVIFGARNEIGLESGLQSDCAQLYGLLERLEGIEIHAVRDATRGGLAAVLNEWAQRSGAKPMWASKPDSEKVCGLEIEIEEEKLPILEEVRGMCEILGLEAMSLANEGVCIIALPKHSVEAALKALHSHPLGAHAAVIGEVKALVKEDARESNGNSGDTHGGLGKGGFATAKGCVIIKNPWGGRRYVEYPQGELLPRIC